MALFWLWLGLPLADPAEHLKLSEQTRKRRELCVIRAAQARDHFEGRQVDQDMTLEQALSRLKEGS